MKTIIQITFLLIIIPCFVYANTIIVDINGTGDYFTIQEGINNASIGDTVLVYPGTYFEIVDFSGKDIVVASLYLTQQDTSFISQTIIDGNNENYRLVRFTNGESENAKLVGFTITHASVPQGYSEKMYSVGLGIYINGSSPVIEKNRIINNDYNDWYFIGGGIVMENSSAKITGNIIQNNYMAFHGGGIYISKCTGTLIENNQILHNMLTSGYAVSYGAGIYIDSSQYILVRNNVINDNYFNNAGYGGGLYILRSNHILVLNNSIDHNGNYGQQGGGILTTHSSAIAIVGNLLYNNRAKWHGGGLYLNDSEVLLANNTICFNQGLSPDGDGGGLACKNSSPVIQNTILYSNIAASSGNQVFLDANADPDFFYSDVEGGISAFGLADTVSYNGLYENNIDSSPQFILSGDHPYNLDNGSPCINAGNPDTNGLYLPAFDLYGATRIIHDTIDMGSYEYQFVTDINIRSAPGNLLVYPNPAKGKFTIHIPNDQFKKGLLIVYDIEGNPVSKCQMDKQADEYDFSFLPGGIYFVKIISGDFIETEPIILY